MTINESLRDWISSRLPFHDALEGVDLVTMGEVDDLTPPLLAIYETGADTRETDGVVIPGVTDYQITCELHTVPTADGTSAADDMEMRQAFYDILADRDAIDWMSERNGWKVFDIRAAGPTSDAAGGRRASTFKLMITACPA